MPRGRPKGSKNKVKSVSYNLNLPKGGTRFLNTQKRIAAKAAAYAGMSAAMLSGYGTPKKARGRPRKSPVVAKYPISSFNAATPAERATMLSSLTGTLNYKNPIKIRRQATPAQLANLLKARTARLYKRSNSIMVV
jgi:hypothetical protein